MIKCTIKKQDDQYVSVEVNGHAGFARKGKDIVCASVSILVINTLNSIEAMTDDYFEGQADEKHGGSICYEFPKGHSYETKILLDSLVLGLKQVSAEYSKYITLLIEEV